MKVPNAKILLVDDNAVKLMVSKNIIKNRTGIDCQIAQSGEEAMMKFKKGQVYDIVVLDVMMPGITGFETASQISKYCSKNKIKTPHMISYTILQDKKVQDKAIKCGISDYISKNDDDDLIKAIERWMELDSNSFSIY